MKDYDEKFSSTGDLAEFYDYISNQEGRTKANIWYLFQIFSLVFTYLKFSILYGVIMFNNYLKITIRHFRKHKGYSFINIMGLAVGLATSILIILFVRYEFSYDKFHENSQDIYRVLLGRQGGDNQSELYNSAWGLFGASLKANYPDVLSATRVQKMRGVVSSKNHHFNESAIYMVDQDFLNMFTFPLLSGDKFTALEEPFSVLLTHEMAVKYFGNNDPIGMTLTLQIWPYDNPYDYKITAILEDIPENTHFGFDFLVSLNSWFTLEGKANLEKGKQWVERRLFTTYIKLDEGNNPNDFEAKLSPVSQSFIAADSETKVRLQPLTDIHLYGNLSGELEQNGDIKYVYIFSSIALFILLIACFNYMNLSAARSESRSREVGMRKVLGAKRIQLVRQFLVESVLFCLTALIISIIIVKLLLSAFNSFIDRNLTYDIFVDPNLILVLFVITFIVGLISGSYPAFYLSNFNPINIIKGKLGLGTKGSGSFIFRNILVVAQFAISIILIICTLVIFQQLHFIREWDLGYQKEHIVTVNIMDDNVKQNYPVLQNELQKYPGIKDISVTREIPTTIRNIIERVNWEGYKQEDGYFIYYNGVDYNFLDCYGIKLIMGRNFSQDFPSDKDNAIIINETLAGHLGFENPIGKQIYFYSKPWTVIGVIQDFNFESLYQQIMPFALRLTQNKSTIHYFSFKVYANDLSNTLAFIEEKWKAYSPNYPFELSFLDESIDKIYRTEKQLGSCLNYFTLIAIFIASLGLFGLASFTSERRTKEIGIRKVLGASVPGITVLLSREFTKWVMVANLISWPLAYYFMNEWLQNFAYRIELGIWLFVAAAVSAFIIALLTVSYQSIKAATANPVDSLRYE